MNRIFRPAVLVLLAAGLAGCTGGPAETPNPASTFQIKMEQTEFPLKPWSTEGTHRSAVIGTLTKDGQPVANAVLQAGESKRDLRTGQDGSFEFLLDQSLLGQTTVKVASLDEATVGGKPIPQDQQELGKAIAANLQVQYPIELLSAQAFDGDPGQTVVRGRLIADQAAAVAYFQADKFQIGGVVRDADGQPVEGAIVWIDRDDGEGFAKSTPTGADGRYQMYYLPEEDEETHLSVTIGTDQYTLPENRVFHIPEETSVTIDITLPREGRVIMDQPPTLVSRTAPGALYTGLLVGLEAPKGTDYTVTIPDAAGNFTMTVPTSLWDRHPAFFETNMTQFITEDRKPGDPIPSGFIEIAADAARNVQAKAKSGS